eukprot:jgi/Chrzof1/14182/Cz08g28140.t1
MMAQVLRLLYTFGQQAVLQQFVEHVASHPQQFAVATLIDVALLVGSWLGQSAAGVCAAFQTLHGYCVRHLQQQVEVAPDPKDMAVPVQLTCKCPTCHQFQDFLSDKTRSMWQLQADPRTIEHVSRSLVEQHVTFTTKRAYKRPPTLTATKTQATFAARLEQHKAHMAKLAQLRDLVPSTASSGAGVDTQQADEDGKPASTSAAAQTTTNMLAAPVEGGCTSGPRLADGAVGSMGQQQQQQQRMVVPVVVIDDTPPAAQKTERRRRQHDDDNDDDVGAVKDQEVIVLLEDSD